MPSFIERAIRRPLVPFRRKKNSRANPIAGCFLSKSRSEGLEPPTYKFVACCSIQLSYDRISLCSTDIRRERDSNPRYDFTSYNGLANRRLQPLGHLSTTRTILSRGRGYLCCWEHGCASRSRLSNIDPATRAECNTSHGTTARGASTSNGALNRPLVSLLYLPPDRKTFPASFQKDDFRHHSGSQG